MKVRPLHDRIIVQRLEEGEQRVGGIIIPASLLVTIICPADLIATITSLTLAIRVIGGATGYSVYYNVFANKVEPLFMKYVVPACVANGIKSPQDIHHIVQLTLSSLTEEILHIVGGDQAKYEAIVLAGQKAYEQAYPWVYYCSISFGCVSILAALFLDDVGEFMDEKVAVILH